MLRLLLQILIPVFLWGSLGLWGLAASALLRSHEDPLVLTPGIVFRAIACGPVAFFVNWRKALRSDETRVRKHGQE
jgi:hypothetical protein